MYYSSSKKLQEPGSYEHGYAYALFLLGLRPRTEGDLREKMSGRGYLDAVIEEVVRHLYELNYINDSHFAEVLLQNMKDYKTQGWLKVKLKMMEKKIPAHIIEQVLQNFSLEEEQTIAERFLHKEHISVAELDRAGKAKVMRKLQRRGFRTDVIRTLLFV